MDHDMGEPMEADDGLSGGTTSRSNASTSHFGEGASSVGPVKGPVKGPVEGPVMHNLSKEPTPHPRSSSTAAGLPRTFSGSAMVGTARCMSDSILDSYQRSRSGENLATSTCNSNNTNATFTVASGGTAGSTSSSMAKSKATAFSTSSLQEGAAGVSLSPSRRQKLQHHHYQQHHKTLSTPILNNSGWGTNASFGMLQRSASMKQEILAALSKIQESVKMIQNLYHQSQQSLQQSNSLQLIQFCELQMRQNLSKIVLFAQDEYYRIIVVNTQGIETILSIMNLQLPLPPPSSNHHHHHPHHHPHPHHIPVVNENLFATCNLALGILCTNSTPYQSKVIQLNGIYSIVSSIQHFQQSSKVCSSAIDALCIISYNEESISHLCQIMKELQVLLNVIDDYLYPLSKQNKDILISHLKGICDCTRTTHAAHGADDTTSSAMQL